MILPPLLLYIHAKFKATAITDHRGTLTLSTGSTATVSDVLFDGEIVKSYKVLSGSALEAGRLKFGNVDTTKPFLIAKIYIKSSDKQSGENAGLNTSFWTYSNYGKVGTGSFTETATGTAVANTALKMNTWYDLIVDFSGKSGTMDMFANNGAAIECEILFKDATVVEGNCGTLEMADGDATTSSVNTVLFNGEIVKEYKVVNGKDSLRDTERLRITITDATKPYFTAKIYIKSSEFQNGENSGLKLMFTGYTTNQDMYKKDVTFTDVKTGEMVAYNSLKMNTWYDLVIDLNDFIAKKTLPSDDLVMYPNAAESSADCEIIFKDATVSENKPTK